MVLSIMTYLTPVPPGLHCTAVLVSLSSVYSLAGTGSSLRVLSVGEWGARHEWGEGGKLRAGRPWGVVPLERWRPLGKKRAELVKEKVGEVCGGGRQQGCMGGGGGCGVGGALKNRSSS